MKSSTYKRPHRGLDSPVHLTALLLDKDYHFDPDHVHAVWPRVGKFKPDDVMSVINSFAGMPLQVKSVVQVIGELGVESTALAFNDARNCLIVLQHDDEKYLSEIQRLVTGSNSLTSEKIEIHINDFHTIVTDQKTPKQALEILTKPRFVWTWQRIRNVAMNKGITPKEAAVMLKLCNDAELCNE